jgi:hypothetical protein
MCDPGCMVTLHLAISINVDAHPTIGDETINV